MPWQERFPIHEIRRIDGGRGFRTGKNVFRIGGNTFYNWKNKIPMKILEFKRSGIGLIAEFRGILNRFPNQDLSEYSAGLVYYRTNDLTRILHLVSIIVMLSLFLARNKILRKLVSHISLSGRWILNLLSICTFHFPKILYQFLTYILM